MKNFLTNLKSVIASKGKQEPDTPKKKIELREGTAEMDLFMATAELDSGTNLPHGASHLANLIHYDPTFREWLEMAESYRIAAGENPEEKLLPNEEKRYVSTEALRAWIRYKEGNPEEAIKLLIEVTKASPDAGYIENWGLEWLQAPGKLEALSEDTTTHLFGVILNQFGEAHVAGHKDLQLVRQWADMLQGISYESPMWSMIRIGLLRKAGLFDKALQVAGTIEEAQNWHQAIAIGLILRRKAQLEDAEQAFVRALEFTPEDLSARLEAADTWFEYGKWEQALHWYEEVLKMEADHAWAFPSSQYCHWKLTGEEQWIDKVIEMAKEGNDRAHRLWFEAYGALPEPYDATANVLRQVSEKIGQSAEKEKQGEEFKLKISHLEAPSNQLAFKLEMDRLGCKSVLKVEVERIPDPDPRKPMEVVEWLLWKYDGTDPTPALPAPSPEIVRAIEQLALLPYDPTANWSSASHVAAQLGTEKCAEILEVAVHPPAVPTDSHALAWLPRVQLCVAQVLAQIDTGWDHSVRRQALLSMLFGPSDWTVSAAIRVMTWIARNEQMYQLPIHECFLKLEKSIPEGGYCCWENLLYEQWLSFPFLFDSEKERMNQRLKELNKD